MKENIEEGQMRWCGQVKRIRDVSRVEQVFEAKPGKKKSRLRP